MNNGGWDMKEIAAMITQRSQVTLPAEVRRLLGLQPRGKVVFAIEDDQVRLLPSTFTLESAYGSVAALDRPVDTEAQIRAAKEEKIERAQGRAPAR